MLLIFFVFFIFLSHFPECDYVNFLIIKNNSHIKMRCVRKSDFFVFYIFLSPHKKRIRKKNLKLRSVVPILNGDLHKKQQ